MGPDRAPGFRLRRPLIGLRSQWLCWSRPVACQQEEVKVQGGDAAHWLATGLPNTAEDGNQLTPDEQKRFEEMVEGTSPIPECTELIPQLRTLSACTKYPPQGRTMLQRGALILGKLGAHDTSERLACSCRDATANIGGVIKLVDY